MKNKKINKLLILSFVIVFCILLLLIFLPKGNTQNNSSYADIDQKKLAKCLADKGAVIYGADWCGYTQKQKQLFGSAIKEITYINCEINQEECSAKGITGYPTWQINGQNYPGYRELSELAIISGC